jgi:hypothetical protein
MTDNAAAKCSAQALLSGAGDQVSAASPGGRRFVRWLLAVLGLESAAGTIALAVAPATGRQVDFEVYRMGAAKVLGRHLYTVQLAQRQPR